MSAFEKYLPIARPALGEEEWAALKEPISSGWLTQGPQVKCFEEAFAVRHQSAHALATTSCTTALHLALLALGVGPGDLVVVPSFTWVSTANAVEYCGARPVFCDSRHSDYNIDPVSLERTLSALKHEGKKVKALIVVHLFGLMADMEAILELARRFDIAVVEDAACAAGASLKDRPAGCWGHIGCFSFHPRKIISTGEGGMCTTNDDALASAISSLRSHGGTLSEEQRHNGDAPFLLPDFNILGFNYRMSDLQGAVGRAQLKKLDGFIAGRRALAAIYDRELKAIPELAVPVSGAAYKHSYQSYVCRLIDPSLPLNNILKGLHLAGIGGRAGTHAIHELGYYRNKYALSPSDFPVASELARNTLALPLSNHMTEEDIKRVLAALKDIFSSPKRC